MSIKQEVDSKGFDVVAGVLNDSEITAVLELINQQNTSNAVFRKSADLFAIRQFFKHLPSVSEVVMNSKLQLIISEHFSDKYFLVKSIYFDKPPASNWFVSYHQDLTISVQERIETDGFGPWTVKERQFAVQPPLAILEDNITIRIHLDRTTKENGALKVIPGSHLKGVCRPETINRSSETEVNCEVPRGGVMIMKPLLLHASGRTTNQQRRRVIHLEFSRTSLPGRLQWSELLTINA